MKTSPNLWLVPRLEKAVHGVAVWLERNETRLPANQAEAHVLAFLSAGGPQPIRDVQRSFGHKPSTLTSILDRLEERGFVERRAHPGDRRSVEVRLTGRGSRLGARIRLALGGLERRVSADLAPADVASFERVVRTLERVAAEEPKPFQPRKGEKRRSRLP